MVIRREGREGRGYECETSIHLFFHLRFTHALEIFLYFPLFLLVIVGLGESLAGPGGGRFPRLQRALLGKEEGGRGGRHGGLEERFFPHTLETCLKMDI